MNNTSSNLRLGSAFELFLGLLSNVTLFPNNLMLQNASYMFFLKKKQNKMTTKKSVMQQESNPGPSTSKGNALSIAPHNHC